MARLFVEVESDTSTKPAKKGGSGALVVKLSTSNKVEYHLLYTGNGKLQVFNQNKDLLKSFD